MVFEHRDGTKTMAKITGYATPVDTLSDFEEKWHNNSSTLYL